jgi:hypothetical protein
VLCWHGVLRLRGAVVGHDCRERRL